MSMVAVYSHSKEASNETSKSKKTICNETPQVWQQNPDLIIQRVRMHPETLTRDDVIRLQKMIGNRATIKFLSGLKNNDKLQKPVPSYIDKKLEKLYNEESSSTSKTSYEMHMENKLKKLYGEENSTQGTGKTVVGQPTIGQKIADIAGKAF